MIIETFRQAIQNVWSNKLRTFLTMLGIIIGVMAVIVIVGLGNGMTKSMRDSFSALGTNTLSVQVWGNGSRTVSVEEMYKLPTEYPELIQSISPQIDFSGSGTLKIGTTSYRWSNISGVDENYSAMKNYQIAQGRGLQYMDMKDNKHVCVIGDYLNRVAFGGNGLGQTLKIGANKFRIVGVLAAKVSDPDMQQGSDDDCVYLPYTTAMRLSSQSTVNNYAAVMEDEGRANEAKSAVESELQRLLGSDNGYYVYSASEWLEEMNNMINMVIVILTGIASISLLVGGIGIMNIMLVSVTERQGTHHSVAVCGGSSHHLGPRRRTGHCTGLHRIHGSKQGAAHVHQRHNGHGQPVLQFHRSGLWHLGGDWRAVRLPARKARSAAQPH